MSKRKRRNPKPETKIDLLSIPIGDILINAMANGVRDAIADALREYRQDLVQPWPFETIGKN